MFFILYIKMSLNKLLLQGKTTQGLDIEVASISTGVGTGSIIRGNITVLGITDLQGNTTCESNLTVVNETQLLGGLKVGFPAKSVILDGIFPVAQQTFIPQAGHINQTNTYDQYYQFFGTTLKIQGRFLGEMESSTLSRYFTVAFNVPTGFSIGGSYINRFAPSTGTGGNVAVLANSQPYVLGYCAVTGATTYTMVFYSGDGLGPRVLNNQMMFSYHLTFDDVTEL
jgi:hypothetical protein